MAFGCIDSLCQCQEWVWECAPGNGSSSWIEAYCLEGDDFEDHELVLCMPKEEIGGDRHMLVRATCTDWCERLGYDGASTRCRDRLVPPNSSYNPTISCGCYYACDPPCDADYDCNWERQCIFDGCSDCLQTCREVGLGSCCTGTGCICDSECDDYAGYLNP